VLLEEDGASPAAAKAHRGGSGNALCPQRGPFPFGHGGGELPTALVLRPMPRHADARRIERNGAAGDGGASLPASPRASPVSTSFSPLFFLIQGFMDG
jgi:hypothetical protein